MNKEPETYEELIRKKRCIDLTKYYQLSKDELEQIYNFLLDDPKGTVKGTKVTISLIPGNNANPMAINTMCVDSSIDGIIMDNQYFKIIPHYTPSSGGDYSGGSSSNNNKNNNNNNNNNNNR